MALSKKSVKVSSKNGKDIKLKSASEKTKKKSKIESTKQPIELKEKKLESSEELKNGDILQYSIDTTKPEEKSSSMKIYFPQQFSMLQNMEFLDHISDAKNIIFDNSVYAICKDISTAEEIRVMANGLRFQDGKNFIHRAERLGPAFCAFKRKVVDPTVLTIKKLPIGLKYQDLLCRFPGVLDISLKRKMAKLKFPDADSCKQAWLATRNIIWPQGTAPCADKLPEDCDAVELDEKVDPDEIKFGHPSKFVDDPCVVFLLLKERFELVKGMEVLDVLKIATDIILSKSCTVVFPTFKEALKRRQLLAGHSVGGGEVVTWMAARRHDDHRDKTSRKRTKKTLTKPEADSTEEEEEEEEEESVLAPPAKKSKKERAK